MDPLGERPASTGDVGLPKSKPIYGAISERIAANQANGYPYFHEDPEKVCRDPGGCHVRGWCWSAFGGRSPLPKLITGRHPLAPRGRTVDPFEDDS